VREFARCGTIPVYENRARGSGRQIGLRVIVLPARRKEVAPDPVVFLTGGPGLAAADDPAYVARLLASVRGSRAIVLVDQRGTGQSNPLNCHLYDDGSLQSLLDPMFPIGRVRACRAALANRADLTQYGTTIAADDLADVLSALGYDQVNLVGGSYGTRAALVFLRRHPTRVRSAVLFGVAPPNDVLGTAFGYAGARALNAAFAWCAGDVTCHTAVPDPPGDFAAVRARLDRQPMTVSTWNWGRWRREPVTLTRRLFDERVFFILYQPSRARRMIPLVHRAVAGDWGPLIDAMLREGGPRRSGRSEGMMLSVLCTEDAPRLSTMDTTRMAANSPLGLPIVHELLAACAIWPRGALTGADTLPVRSSVPILMFSGGLDPASPVEWADSAAPTLGNSVHVVNPTGGHAALSPDDVRRIGEFVRQPFTRVSAR
jgi:pimeloyl-ACP methyl ester carboxylesterase